jgi:DNA (cytosine-5)-methyltransferase 1
MTAIDLFAGGGGLTVGLKQAGFTVVSAVEIEKHAFATYKANHPEVRVFRQDVRTVDGKYLRGLSPTGMIDLLAGCPPCQGFSSLTFKSKKTDPRNELVREMGRLIAAIQPRAVMMENVPGLADKGKPLFDEMLDVLEKHKYRVNWDVLQVADYGVPQNRRRLVVLAGKEFDITLPAPTHSRIPMKGLKPWISVKNVIGSMKSPITLTDAMNDAGPQAVSWHVVRTLSNTNLCRLRQAIPGKPWTKISKKLRPNCHQDRKAGFSNVYGRMMWDKVSPAITGGCTTLSKGRFGHPVEDRTISVLEAALLQTFPKNYKFNTPYMEYACDIIGNALPCDFAEVLAKACASAIRKAC